MTARIHTPKKGAVPRGTCLTVSGLHDTVLARARGSLCAFGLIVCLLGCQQTNVVDDGTITANVTKAYLADPTAKLRSVHVETQDGVVRLSGMVDTAQSETAAVYLASQVSGVLNVDDHLDVSNIIVLGDPGATTVSPIDTETGPVVTRILPPGGY